MSDTVAAGTFNAQEEGLPQEAPRVTMPGAQLAARREELGMSVEQAANQLNLAPRQIQAIESDNYSALPGMASIRGFIRSYAKLLRIDSGPLLAAIAAEATPLDEAIPLRRALPAQPFSDNRHLSPGRDRRFSKPLFAMLALGVVIAAAFAAQYAGWISIFPASMSARMDKGVSLLTESARSASAAASAAAASAGSSAKETLSPAASVPVPIQAPSAAPAGDSVAQPGAVAASGPVASPTVPMAAGVTVPPAVAAAAPSSDPVDARAADASNQLQLKLREDSWIEIRRPDNGILISRLVKAGSVESFKITGPVSLTVGNASGVDATLRGVPLNLQGDAKTNVARLNLK